MEHVAVHRGDLGLVHRAVGGAEVHGALGELADAAAGADGLIVDLDAGLLVVGVEPLGVDRIRERSPGAGEGLGVAAGPQRSGGEQSRMRSACLVFLT